MFPLACPGDFTDFLNYVVHPRVRRMSPNTMPNTISRDSGRNVSPKSPSSLSPSKIGCQSRPE